ncbi:MAG TPA: lmo0937 family membrane protein [Segetibacter sp.]
MGIIFLAYLLLFQRFIETLATGVAAIKVWQGFLNSVNKIINMRSLLYIVAVILVIGWLLGVFVYSAGSIIHILIVLAVISLLLAVIRRA